MKLSKKVIAAMSAAALLAMAGTFVACSDDDDDDPEGAITKVDSDNYTVDYDNSEGYGTDSDTKSGSLGTYRAWARTSLKHLGALTKITFKKGDADAGKGSGVMGFAWDLKQGTALADGDDEDNTKPLTFNLLGLRNNNGTLQYYVSRYYNITDKQKTNFGVESANSTKINPESEPTAATEWIVEDIKALSGVDLSGETADVWVEIVAVGDTHGSDEIKALDEYKNASDGAWVVAIYAKDPSQNQDTVAIGKVVIPAKADGAIGSGYDAKPSQSKQAVYANIYKGHHLVGAWEYVDTYAADEVVED